MLNRHHPLVSSGFKDGYTLGVTPGNADVFDRRPDQLPAIGDQHNLVSFLHRERRGDMTVTLIGNNRGNAFAATTGSPVFIRRRPFAKAIFRDRPK